MFVEEVNSYEKSATFPTSAIFKMVKDGGMLTPPEETAKKIIEFLFKEDFEHGTVIDIHD
ncbi:hypothetical protein FHS16_000552 [Paenibacillus endophyticus]|uniref:Uncharacterized protein n=1 Tax=Paenibacillus endophyticus TaxID=1294268 RepID=A0A7W5G8D5_9BACL|nr:hypothetical protein [Paenibacillus endophyticus]MBB3150520.1 hypothetical protein [Paenibacillus endophyticus]